MGGELRAPEEEVVCAHLRCQIKQSGVFLCRPGQSASRELLCYLNDHFNKLIGNATDKLMTFSESVSTLSNEHHGECPDREVMEGQDRSISRMRFSLPCNPRT